MIDYKLRANKPFLSHDSFGQCFITMKQQTRTEKLAPREGTESALFVMKVFAVTQSDLWSIPGRWAPSMLAVHPQREENSDAVLASVGLSRKSSVMTSDLLPLSPSSPKIT